MKKKHLFATGIAIAIFIIAFGIMSASADTIGSGSCGENLTWTLDNNGTFTISGSGDMYNYKAHATPWANIRANIKSVIIGENVTSIGDWSFYDCTNIADLTVPENITRIGYWAFFNCTSLNQINWNAKNVVDFSEGDMPFGSAGKNTDGVSVIFGNSVETIPAYLFNSNVANYIAKITNVVIGDNVRSIGVSAFNTCTYLEDVVIGDAVTSVGEYAFCSCRNLTNLILPDSVETIDKYAFSGSGIENIRIPKTVTSIGERAFYDCAGLSTVRMSNGLLAIGKGAFEKCINLERITIPKSVTTIGEYAFSSCERITDFTIPENVTNIGHDAFQYCSSLMQIDWNAKNVNDFNYDDNVFLKAGIDGDGIDVVFGSNVQKIPDGLFSTNVSKGGPKVVSVTFEGNIASIGDSAFNGCFYLENIIIPDGTTSIGERAFYGCTGLITITIPNDVTTIGDFAFEDCSAITDVYYDGLENEWNSISVGSFNDELLDANIHFKTKTPAEILCDIINEQATDSCEVDAELQLVTFKKDFSCRSTIEIPKGNRIILDFNGHTVTTEDFFMPFEIPEQAEIIFKGEGVLTNKEEVSGTSSGGIGGGAALISNEGKLTINGITVIGVGLNGIHNDGTLTVQSGKITVGDYALGKDAIGNSGTIEVFGGEIIGGNATRDGRDGGDGISSASGVVVGDGTYPVALYGGILCGGKGLGDGENGRAISTRFNIGEVCIAYESDDGETYSETEDTRSYARYLKIVNKNSKPEIEDGDLGDLGNPSAQNVINANNVIFDGEKVTFDIVLISGETITGNVYVAVYEGKRLSLIKHYTAETTIPVSIEFTNGQNIKVFWWDENLVPKSLPAEIEI